MNKDPQKTTFAKPAKRSLNSLLFALRKVSKSGNRRLSRVCVWLGMGRSSKGPSASNLFKEYNSSITSRTATAASRSVDRDDSNKDPNCCCCTSTSVLIFTNSVTFVLSLGLLIVGAFINNEVSVRALPSTIQTARAVARARTHRAQPTASPSAAPQGWELRTFDIIGNLVLGLGIIIALVSMVGIFAGRTNSRTLLFLYFMSIMLVTYLLLLVVVWALLEGDAMGELLDGNWEQVQKVVGTDASRDDVVELMQDYMYATTAVGGAGLLMLVSALVSTVRLLGLRAIAYSCLLSLAMLGGACLYSGITSRGEVPVATTALLYACGAVQVLVAICGLSAFKNLNRECARWFFIVSNARSPLP